VPRDQNDVPANWLDLREVRRKQRGEAEQRLQVRAGKTLHLITISCNVYLRGADTADPELHVAKSMVRRAAEVLARLEDAIVFNGLPKEKDPPYPVRGKDGRPVVEPLIYRISGGRDLTGLLQAPDTFFHDALIRRKRAGGLTAEQQALKTTFEDLDRKRTELVFAKSEIERAQKVIDDPQADPAQQARAQKHRALAQAAYDEINRALPGAEKAFRQAEAAGAKDIMCVQVRPAGQNDSPIVDAVVAAVEKLENRGHFGPFAAVFGHELFSDATKPVPASLVLPTDRFVPFLDGGPLHRSSTLPDDEGVIIALGGAPVELVLGHDMDLKCLQVTLEPRYVLRVFERFVLRIKELDAVCRITKSLPCLNEKFRPRKAES
jgi:hypothetical protein